MISENLTKLAIGTAGVITSEAAQSVAAASPEDISTVGNLFIQIAIAIATIISLFKRKKTN